MLQLAAKVQVNNIFRRGPVLASRVHKTHFSKFKFRTQLSLYVIRVRGISTRITIAAPLSSTIIIINFEAIVDMRK